MWYQTLMKRESKLHLDPHTKHNCILVIELDVTFLLLANSAIYFKRKNVNQHIYTQFIATCEVHNYPNAETCMKIISQTYFSKIISTLFLCQIIAILMANTNTVYHIDRVTLNFKRFFRCLILNFVHSSHL